MQLNRIEGRMSLNCISPTTWVIANALQLCNQQINVIPSDDSSSRGRTKHVSRQHPMRWVCECVCVCLCRVCLYCLRQLHSQLASKSQKSSSQRCQRIASHRIALRVAKCSQLSLSWHTHTLIRTSTHSWELCSSSWAANFISSKSSSKYFFQVFR